MMVLKNCVIVKVRVTFFFGTHSLSKQPRLMLDILV